MSMQAPGGTWNGYPKGVYLLSFTELWERFSYYGMLALLVLFLTADTAAGGFGWDRPEALKLYGFYTGFIFSAPIIGGWLANNHWGERRCILTGGLLLVAGHACLAAPAVLPWIAGQLTGADLHAVWVDAGVPLGAPFPDAARVERLAAAARAAGIDAGTTELVYRLVALAFLGGLTLIASGTALLKPTISSIIGRFFDAGDERRDGAFALFFVGIYIGGLSANFIVGFLGERVAWHWGFSAAGFGMALGLCAYLLRQRAWLADLGRVAVRPERGALGNLSAEERARILAILVQGLFTIAYAAAFYQKGGLLTLFAREQLDRGVGSLEVPVTWLLAISTGTFILVTPFLTRLWRQLALRGRDPDSATKLAWGLLIIGAGYVFIAFAVAHHPPGGPRASWGWLALTYVCFGIGDSLVWPTQISMVSRLAPPAWSTFFVGAWYITIGLGSWLTGYIGALGYSWGMFPVFASLALALGVLGALLWCLTPWLAKLSREPRARAAGA